jgi:hypothetical protein
MNDDGTAADDDDARTYECDTSAMEFHPSTTARIHTSQRHRRRRYVVVVVVIGDISKDPRSLENQTANGSRRDATADSSSTSTH